MPINVVHDLLIFFSCVFIRAGRHCTHASESFFHRSPGKMVRRWCSAQADKHTGIPEERREYDLITPKEISLLICIWFMFLLLCCYANLNTFCRPAHVFPQ